VHGERVGGEERRDDAPAFVTHAIPTGNLTGSGVRQDFDEATVREFEAVPLFAGLCARGVHAI
jgi:hypothetical protein